MPRYNKNRDAEVTVTEQGILKTERIQDESPGLTTAVTHTVPTGKIWVLKGFNSYQTGGTVSSLKFRCLPHDSTITHVFKTIATPDATNLYNLETTITLQAGSTVSALWTSSEAPTLVQSNLIYLEQDE